MTHIYAIGIGSNRPHGRWGPPERVVAAAAAALARKGIATTRMSGTIRTRPIGSARRRFANAAILAETPLAPDALLGLLKTIERDFGRRGGRRWGDRVLDLDILLWSGGRWISRALTVPHARLAERQFALAPLVQIAPEWRIGAVGSVRQATARLTRPRPVHRSRRRSGP